MDDMTEFRSVQTRRVILVRHGESTWNALGLVQGHATGPVLTSEGHRQARRCAAALTGRNVGGLFSSDLCRAVETAKPIGAALGLEAVLDARLRERNLGSAEGMPIASLRPQDSGFSGGRVVDPDAAPLGGESIRELYERAVGALVDLVTRPVDGDVVVVCHGGVVRVLLAWLDGVGPAEMAWGSVANATVIERSVPMASVVA